MMHPDELSGGKKKNPITLFSLIFQSVSFVLMAGELDVGQTTGNTANSRYMKGSLSYVIAFFFHSFRTHSQAPIYLLMVPKTGKSH